VSSLVVCGHAEVALQHRDHQIPDVLTRREAVDQDQVPATAPERAHRQANAGSLDGQVSHVDRLSCATPPNGDGDRSLPAGQEPKPQAAKKPLITPSRGGLDDCLPAIPDPEHGSASASQRNDLRRRERETKPLRSGSPPCPNVVGAQSQSRGPAG
jgi:hypothetical protein